MNILQVLPHDHGPLYKETVMTRFPVEPFNTFSNFLFLAVVIYFGIRVYKNTKQHLFLAYCIPIIFLSFIGGTIYHATRSANLWLYLDWVPIIALCIATAFYFVFKTAKTNFGKVLWFVIIFIITFGFRQLPLPQNFKISIGYIATALALLLPIFSYMYQTKWKNSVFVFMAILSFCIAIGFRIADKKLDLLPMGSHWLWHSFGAIAVFFLMKYMYEDHQLKQNISLP
ncbi:hypothetical protein ACG2LH_05300 [Zhouia sp. PK063]|uniref:hypothetical protein n=1 Tax=Zhouia sp. PK063 TaxID=3373602 RepID=UPI00379B59FA